MDGMGKTQLLKLIDEWIIGRNAERDRALIKRRLIDGICFEPLSEEFGLSVRQTKSIVHKYIKVLKMHENCP